MEQKEMLEILQHAYVNGQGATTIGQIAKLLFSGKTPNEVVDYMDKYAPDWDSGYSRQFRYEFCRKHPLYGPDGKTKIINP